MSELHPFRSVVMVGGGLAGCSSSSVSCGDHRAARRGGPRADRLCAGVAYSGAEPRHMTNVPAVSMTVDPNDRGAFARWLGQHGDAQTGDDRDACPRRRLFGDAMGELLPEALTLAYRIGRLGAARLLADRLRPGDYHRLSFAAYVPERVLRPILASALAVVGAKLAC